MPGRALRLGAEGAHGLPGLAQRRAGAAAPVHRAAVEAAHVLAVLGAREPGGEVAPQRLALVPVHAHVHAALGVHVAVGGGVVAVHRVELVRVQAAEHVARIGVQETVEQLADLVLARVGLRRDEVAALHLALEVQGQAAFGDDVVVAVVHAHRHHGAADGVLGHGDVGQRDHEQVAAGDVHVQRALHGLLAVAHFDVEAVLAHGQQELGGELAVQVHRIRAPVDAQRLPLRDVLADDAHARAVDRDVLQAQVALAEHRFGELALGDLLGVEAGETRVGLGTQLLLAALGVFRAHQGERVGIGLVHAAVAADGAQHVLQLVALAQADVAGQFAVPLHLAHRGGRHRQRGQRGHPVGVGAAVDDQLVPLGERRVVAVAHEAHRLGDAAVGELHQRAGLHVEVGRGELGILGRPQHAAARQVHGEAAAHLGAPRLLPLDVHAPVGLQLAGVAGLRLGLAPAADAQHGVAAVTAAAVVAGHFGGGRGGAGLRPGAGRQRAEQADQGVVQQLHACLHDQSIPVHLPAPGAAAPSVSTRSRARCSGVSLASIASRTACARRSDRAWL